MFESDLLPGDLIFFCDSLEIPQHVAIYNGIRDEVPFVSHAVTGKYDAVMTTRLKAEDGPYFVMRLQNFDLAASAAHRMRIWGENGVPFAYSKTDFVNTIMDNRPYCYPKIGVLAGCELAQKHYADNFYRYIEYAAQPALPFHPENMEGFRCAEALVAAFNVETLLQNNCIQKLDGLNEPLWISDKLFDTSKVDFSDFSDPYLRYLEGMASGYEYLIGFEGEAVTLLTTESQSLPGVMPTICAWDFEVYPSIEDYIKVSSSVLRLDSKLTWSASLYEYCRQHPGDWQDLGCLVVEKRQYAPEVMSQNAALWREHVKKLFETAEEKQKAVIEHLQSSPSSVSFSFTMGGLHRRSPSEAGLTREEEIEESLKSQAVQRYIKWTSPRKRPPESRLQTPDLPQGPQILKLRF